MAQAKQQASGWARKALLVIWLSFFVLNLAVVLFLYFDAWIEGDNFKVAMQQLNASYAPYLGVILLYYWGSAGSAPSVRTGVPLGLALVCSVLWNALLLVFLLARPIEEAVDNIKDVGVWFSWLVAGAIGYYFANSVATAEPSDSGG